MKQTFLCQNAQVKDWRNTMDFLDQRKLLNTNDYVEIICIELIYQCSVWGINGDIFLTLDVVRRKPNSKELSRAQRIAHVVMHEGIEFFLCLYFPALNDMQAVLYWFDVISSF